MNLSKGTRDRLVLAAVMVGPMVGVLGFRAGAGVQPRTSQAAAMPAPEAATATPAAATLTPAQRAAAAYLEARPVPLANRSPMHSTPLPGGSAAAAVESDAGRHSEADEVPMDAPSLTLSTIYSSAASVAAIVNGRVYRAGDRVNKDWTIREIDARAMTVLVEGPRGRTLRLTQPRAN